MNGQSRLEEENQCWQLWEREKDQPEARIKKSLEIAVRFGGIDGDHHKAWVIDQIVRALTGCPGIKDSARDCYGKPYEYTTFGESEEYQQFLRQAQEGEEGPDTYKWRTGIAP